MGKAMNITKKSTIALLKDVEWMVDNLIPPAILAYILVIAVYV